MRHVARVLALVLALAASVSSFLCLAAEPQLTSGDYVAIIGDSITEQRLYSLFIEDYLLMCKPALDLRATQFGWGGETAPGFAGRMANDTLRFRPSVATTCFGMNDGGYSPMDPAKGQRYREGQESIVAQLKKAGVRLIVVGSPGVVDADTFGGNNPQAAAMYNKTLAALRDIARDVAKEECVVFADVYDPMMAAMTKAKAQYGKAYHVGGGDGVHPNRNGHLVMAYAFLKAMGCDGNIGTITVDLAASKAEATEGHQVLSCQGGAVEVESSRYPFCFFGEADKPNATRGIIEFFPFNEELNRFKLVVRGAQGKIKITWGKTSKEYAAAELANGVNLAAEFLDNPFSEPFAKVEGAIAQKQGMEVGLIKTLIHNLPAYQRAAPEEAPAIDRIAEGLVRQDKQAREAAAAEVQPVKHTIRIEALE
ncbi:MAG: SGNH/GDSL hydrolase family protein [Phycisphaerae bacterium]|nr:SGNH/GDSL hydrolase family protein [Phycisphaerae bacterium]